MKQLKIEHFSAYFPYRLRLIDGDEDVSELVELSTNNQPIVVFSDAYGVGRYKLDGFAKPILRPISDLTKQITHNGETFVPLDWIHENTPIKAVLCTDTEGKVGLFCDNIQSSHYNAWPHSLVRTLLHLHFDVYNLIEAGVAIDINTLPK